MPFFFFQETTDDAVTRIVMISKWLLLKFSSLFTADRLYHCTISHVVHYFLKLTLSAGPLILSWVKRLIMTDPAGTRAQNPAVPICSSLLLSSLASITTITWKTKYNIFIPQTRPRNCSWIMERRVSFSVLSSGIYGEFLLRLCSCTCKNFHKTVYRFANSWCPCLLMIISFGSLIGFY